MATRLLFRPASAPARLASRAISTACHIGAHRSALTIFTSRRAEQCAPMWQAVEMALLASRAGADAGLNSSRVAIHLSVVRPYARDGVRSARSPRTPRPVNAAAPLPSRAVHAVCQDSRATDSHPAHAAHLAEVLVGHCAPSPLPG